MLEAAVAATMRTAQSFDDRDTQTHRVANSFIWDLLSKCIAVSDVHG